MFKKFIFIAIISIFTLGCFGFEFSSSSNSRREIRSENFVSKNNNFDQRSFSYEKDNTFSTNLNENDTNKYDNDTFFWVIQEKGDPKKTLNNNNETLDSNASDGVTDEVVTELLNDKEIKFQNTTVVEEITTFSQEDSQEKENYQIQEADMTLQEEYERMFLPRNNCNLEISIQNFEVAKIHFKFESLKNHSAGSCCIILNGRQNTKLAIIITDISLAKDAGTEKEVETLKVISKNNGIDFVLKKFDENEVNQSVLLSESSKVFIFLQYNVTSIESKNFNTRFNLEAFNYERKDLHWSI